MVHWARPQQRKPISQEAATDRPWYITQRWQQYEGEARANLLRIAVIGTFYLIHLWNYFSSQGRSVRAAIAERTF